MDRSRFALNVANLGFFFEFQVFDPLFNILQTKGKQLRLDTKQVTPVLIINQTLIRYEIALSQEEGN